MAGAAIPPEPTPSRRLLFLVTEDWYFWGHRLALARAARDAGYAVTVATRVDAFGDHIHGEGFTLVPLAWKRRSLDPFRLVAETLRIIRLYRLSPPTLSTTSRSSPSCWELVRRSSRRARSSSMR